MNELFKRKGIIPISRELFNENPEALLKVFENVLIIKADNDFFKNIITYYAYSNNFDSLKEGEVAPEYFPVITEDEGEIKIVKWERR